MFAGDVLHELLLMARQKTKLRNAFSIQLDINVKLSKAQILKKDLIRRLSWSK